jgi:molybdopterin molybdotransferase
MDGYAVRLADLQQHSLEVAGEASMGQPPPTLPVGKAVRIFTGAPVPAATEAVIQREHVTEEPPQIILRPFPKPPVSGMNIRRQGENARAGETVVSAGISITAATAATLASFGCAQLSVYRRVRMGIITTGSELVAVDASAAPWQIHDSNGPSLAALFATRAWVDVFPPARVPDDRETMQRLVVNTLAWCDAVLLTGGVSAGQYDFVPDVIAAIGGETIFHRLPLRPGAPVFGAVGPKGQAILGLPGNPVSVLVTARRLAWFALMRLAGFAEPRPRVPVVGLSNVDGKSLKDWWCRMVRLTGAGQAELVPTRGSGDVVSMGRSDGFVEVPPETTGAGPWPFYSWES